MENYISLLTQIHDVGLRQKLVERAQTSPLTVMQQIRGDGGGTAKYGASIKSRTETTEVSIWAEVGIKCGGNEGQHLLGMQYCQEMVAAALQGELHHLGAIHQSLLLTSEGNSQ